MSRVAVITGGARGIGAAIALRLARDGHDVAVVDLDEDACAETVNAIEVTGQRALGIGANITSEDAVTAAVERISSELGDPVVLVNNAGILRNKTLANMSLEEWQLVLDVHLGGTFLMTRACQPYMRSAQWGRIISISSIAAVGFVGQANYAAAKAGILGFTKTIALELGRHGITANAVAPGFTITDMTRAVAERDGIDFEKMVSEMASKIPIGRAGTPEDIANAVSFFADERAGFVSGQTLYVSGGPID
jgi:3-oxoacyl-[acyl-carrier protein] reductase